MRYVFYYRHKFSNYDEYTYKEKIPTRNEPLRYLFYYLDGGERDGWLELEEDKKDPSKFVLWSRDNIKKSLTPDQFEFNEDYFAYLKECSKYRLKRFAEMPAIRISRQNYEQLKEQFETLYQRRPQYLIMREHDDGHVDMLEQKELSPEDIKNMDREHKIYQNYEKRLKAYQKAHPNRSYIWRSPEDNEFESDFALYDPSDEQGLD